MPDVTLTLPRGVAILRRATAADLPAIVGLLADDPISRSRGDAGGSENLPALEKAFAAIDSDPAQQLLVVAGPSGDLVATMQLTVIPGLARAGASRLQIEAVRVRTDMRARGIGGAMIGWALDAAPALGAGLVQLTSDAARVDAHRFTKRSVSPPRTLILSTPWQQNPEISLVRLHPEWPLYTGVESISKNFSTNCRNGSPSEPKCPCLVLALIHGKHRGFYGRLPRLGGAVKRSA